VIGFFNAYGISRIQLIKGYFENTLEAFADRKFALLHLDVDLYRYGCAAARLADESVGRRQTA
jgi:hypothetical protein